MKFTRLTVLVAASAAVAFAQLPTTKMLTVDVAQAIAQDAMMTCRANGYHVTVQVVDSGNFLKAFLRDDGAVVWQNFLSQCMPLASLLAG